MRRILFAIMVSVMLGILGGFPLFADAQPAANSPQNAVKVGDRYYRKRTEITFGNDTIQGDLTRPDGEYIEARRHVKLGRLIQLREHWKERISQGINDF
jgi:hypothetical protein